MSEVTEFASDWVSGNVRLGTYDHDRQEIDRYVDAMVADAGQHRFSREALESELGDLAAYISEAMDTAMADSAGRFGGRDSDP